MRDLLLNTKEDLNESQNSFSRHSGVGQNLVKTIVYWMLVFTSMTIKILNQSFPNLKGRSQDLSPSVRDDKMRFRIKMTSQVIWRLKNICSEQK